MARATSDPWIVTAVYIKTDSTYRSNAIICDFSTDTRMLTALTEGVYDLAARTLVPEDCVTAPPTSIRIELIGRDLILSYPCFEPCQAKYRMD